MRSGHAVLIIGGSGLVGAQAAKLLRRFQPELPITMGERNFDQAAAAAREVGGTDAVRVDLEQPGLGLPEGKTFSAIAQFLKDDTLNALKHAQAKGVPYLGSASARSEEELESVISLHRRLPAPVLMNYHWLVGAATLPALHFARELRSIDSMEIAAVIDEEDLGEPAAHSHFERMMTDVGNTLIFRDGKFHWVSGDAAVRTLQGVDGHELRVRAYGLLDLSFLTETTGARSLRFDLAVGPSASRRRGELFSTEVIIELTGQRQDGTAGHVRYELVHPGGKVPVTALSAAVELERLLGLVGGPPVTPTLHLPERLIDPAHLVLRLEEAGTRIQQRG